MHGRLSSSIGQENARDHVEPAPSLRNQPVTLVTPCVVAVDEKSQVPREEPVDWRTYSALF
jgi:hypothetical protein